MFFVASLYQLAKTCEGNAHTGLTFSLLRDAAEGVSGGDLSRQLECSEVAQENCQRLVRWESFNCVGFVSRNKSLHAGPSLTRLELDAQRFLYLLEGCDFSAG
jgi:hypothetical protein